ncbi:unnamed protein product [Prunus armeniaca]
MKLAIMRFTTRHRAGHRENSNIPLTTRARAIHTIKLDGFYNGMTQFELLVELKGCNCFQKKFTDPIATGGEVQGRLQSSENSNG